MKINSIISVVSLMPCDNRLLSNNRSPRLVYPDNNPLVVPLAHL